MYDVLTINFIYIQRNSKKNKKNNLCTCNFIHVIIYLGWLKEAVKKPVESQSKTRQGEQNEHNKRSLIKEDLGGGLQGT